jgi:hypothetical protein
MAPLTVPVFPVGLAISLAIFVVPLADSLDFLVSAPDYNILGPRDIQAGSVLLFYFMRLWT